MISPQEAGQDSHFMLLAKISRKELYRQQMKAIHGCRSRILFPDIVASHCNAIITREKARKPYRIVATTRQRMFSHR